jgi:hypothetical protein
MHKISTKVWIQKIRFVISYYALLNLSRDSITRENNLITLFTKNYHLDYIELRPIMYYT